VDGSESESKKQDVYGIFQDQLREEIPLDGDEWETVADATKFDQPYVKARSPAQGAATSTQTRANGQPVPKFLSR
jgi:hypothetical protein